MSDQHLVPFFNYPHVYLPDRAQYLEIFDSVCSRGAFIQQSELLEFENALAAFAGSRFAIGVANGTDALVIALRVAGVQPGDEVIFCSHTFVATAAAIRHVGAVPVPAECGPDRMIDPQSVAGLVGRRTTAIMPTQLNGRTADMAELGKIAAENGLVIVEDAAQALGSRFDDIGAGNFGAAGTLSFYPAKSLGCFGDGGAILCNDESIRDAAVILRDHGRNGETGLVEQWGYNSRLDNLQAAILQFKLQSFAQEIEKRRHIAAMYDEQLRDLSQLTLPPPPDADSRHFDTYQNYEVTATDRDALREFLSRDGVGTILQWGGVPVHLYPGLGLEASLPYTEQFFERCLLLPMNTSLSDDDVTYVAQSIRRFYDRGSGR